MIFVKAAYAQCPICIVTVGGGMLIAKKLGIDDLLVSIWISALNVAIAFWLAPKISRSAFGGKIKYLNNKHLLSFVLLATTLLYFQFTDQIGASTNRAWGVDKILFGQIIGFLTMAAGNHSYQFIKKRLGHTPFPYAKVAFPLGSVLLVTFTLKLFFRL
ncbi:MAG: hypothetical protein UU09_C0001G0011 [Microgenomates group bacterium GW2011_GWA2_40_6]|nr:MAG: hypothetical protein UU09_C0001G0011 [Microgenomates group bacterium GW2011_GWA2_40_6]